MAAPETITISRIGTLLSLPGRTRQLRLPWIPLIIVIVLLVCTVFAPLLTPHDPGEISILESRTAPSLFSSHPLGTDVLGRDVLARLIFGARTAMFISVVALGTGAFVGTVLGLMGGYRRG